MPNELCEILKLGTFLIGTGSTCLGNLQELLDKIIPPNCYASNSVKQTLHSVSNVVQHK